MFVHIIEGVIDDSFTPSTVTVEYHSTRERRRDLWRGEVQTIIWSSRRILRIVLRRRSRMSMSRAMTLTANLLRLHAPQVLRVAKIGLSAIERVAA